jgi:glycosyltransferase involved in cell wall biosynthesis
MAEAMALGVVPVVADVGELSDLVRNGENGSLVEPNHVDAFVDSIKSLLDDGDHWRRCSRAAVETARRYSHVDVVAQRWRECLQVVVSGWISKTDRKASAKGEGFHTAVSQSKQR